MNQIVPESNRAWHQFRHESLNKVPGTSLSGTSLSGTSLSNLFIFQGSFTTFVVGKLS